MYCFVRALFTYFTTTNNINFHDRNVGSGGWIYYSEKNNNNNFSLLTVIPIGYWGLNILLNFSRGRLIYFILKNRIHNSVNARGNYIDIRLSGWKWSNGLEVVWTADTRDTFAHTIHESHILNKLWRQYVDTQFFAINLFQLQIQQNLIYFNWSFMITNCSTR